MQWIDWPGLAFNSLWILGLGLGLAVLGWAYGRSRHTWASWRAELGKPVYQHGLNISGVLLSLGMALSSSALWEQIAWGVLTVLFIVQTWMGWRRLSAG